jgi:hypothetical protein
MEERPTRAWQAADLAVDPGEVSVELSAARRGGAKHVCGRCDKEVRARPQPLQPGGIEIGIVETRHERHECCGIRTRLDQSVPCKPEALAKRAARGQALGEGIKERGVVDRGDHGESFAASAIERRRLGP